jgi:hypothetical protein
VTILLVSMERSHQRFFARVLSGGLVIILVLAYSIFAFVCPEESITPSSLSVQTN